jgi:hypothetical protein
MASSIRPTRAIHPVPSPSYLPHNFAILKIGRSGLFAMSACPSLREADSLQSDVEDELDVDIDDEGGGGSPRGRGARGLAVTSPPASVSFDVLPSPCPEPYSELASFAVPLAARPLRC